jgi:tyrosyl-tRNA synthetase
MNFDEQVAYLMQGTEYGDQDMQRAMSLELHARLEEAAGEGRPLRVYCGFDPRTSNLHLGHTVPMRKLRQFQELGHEVIFLVGDYTSLIGDPSDQDQLRPQLTPEEIENNARTYAEQAYKVLDRERTVIRYNHEWLSKLTLADLIKLASNFTIQQFLSRENFKLRWENGDPVFLHETFYAIMQGYDAYSLQADVQVGGTDQLFNIVTAARKLMTYLGAKPNIPIIMGILPGTDGEVKMSKSLGNHIPLLASPEDMYGKVMSIPDKAMPDFFRLVTRYTPPQIAAMLRDLDEGRQHPRDVKMLLAREIVEIYHSTQSAVKAAEHFSRVFQQGSPPEEMPVFKIANEKTVVDILFESGLVGSKSEGRRLVQQHAVRLDGNLIDDPSQTLERPGVLQAGKRRFLRLVE